MLAAIFTVVAVRDWFLVVVYVQRGMDVKVGEFSFIVIPRLRPRADRERGKPEYSLECETDIGDICNIKPRTSPMRYIPQ